MPENFGGDIIFNTGDSGNEIKQLVEVIQLLSTNIKSMVTESNKADKAMANVSDIKKKEQALIKLAETQEKQAKALREARSLYDMQGAILKKSATNYDNISGSIVKTNTFLLKNNSTLRETIRINENGSESLKKFNVTTEDSIIKKKREEAVITKANAAHAREIKKLEKKHLAALVMNADYDKAAAKMRAAHTEALKLNRAYDVAAAKYNKAHNEAMSLNRAYDANVRLQKILASQTLKNVQITKSYNAALNKETIAYKGVNAAGQTYAATVTKVGRTVTNVSTRLKDANKSTKGLTLSWKTFARVVAVQSIHRIISLIVQELREATIRAKDFELRIAEIQTISQKNQLSSEAWAEGLKKVSNNLGIDVIDQAEAAYQALSNQITEGAETFEFLTQASKFAITTVSSSADSVKLLSAALNAYELKIEDTNKVAANFFKTIELGRIRSSELADTWGKVAVPAKLMGVSMSELNASLAFMTIQGIKADEAMTLLRNVILKTSKPSNELKKVFKEIGVESGEAAIAAYGWFGFLEELDKRTQGSSTEIGKLFTRQRAQTGFSLFSGRLDEVNATLTELKEGTEDYNKANEIALNNVGRQWEILGTKISNMFLSIGKVIVDITVNTAKFLGLFDDIKIAQEIEKEEAKIRAANDKLIESNNEVINKYIQGLNLEVAQANIANNKIIAVNNARIKILIKSFDTYKNSIIGGYKALITTVKNDIKGFSTELDKITAGGKSFEQFVKGFNLDIGKQIFELDLEDKTVSRQIEAIGKEYKATLERAQKVSLFDREGAKQELSRAKELANQGITLSRQLNKENKKVGEERLKIQEEQKELEKETQEIQRKYLLANINIEASINKTVAERNKLRETAAKDYGKQLNAIHVKQKSHEKALKKLRIDNTANKTFSDYKKVYNDLAAIATGIRERQQVAESKRIKELTTERAKSILLLGELEKRVRETNAFDLKKLLASGDVDIINKGVAEYEKAAQALVAVQSKLGVKDNGVDTQVKDIRETADLTIVNIQNKELQKQQKEYNDIIAKAAKERLKLITDNEKAINVKLSKARELSAKLEAASVAEFYGDPDNVGDKNIENLAANLGKMGRELDVLDAGKIKEFRLGILKLGGAFRQSTTPGSGYTYAQYYEDSYAAFQDLLNDQVLQLKQSEEQIKKTEALRASHADLLTQAENWKKSVIGIKDTTDATLTVTQQIATLEKQMTDNMVLRAEAQDRLNKSTLTGMMEQAAFAKEQIVNTFDILGGLFNTPVLKANGGRINGTDTVPAMLTPGEFVVNKYASQRFLGQLTAMNNVKGYANGGTVTNNSQSVGDINVSIDSSGNSNIDGRAVAHAVRREIRRGTIRNF